MLKELKQVCLKNWDLAVKWEAWSILKDNKVEEVSHLFFYYWIREVDIKWKQEGSRIDVKKTSLTQKIASQITMGHSASDTN